MLNTKKIHKFWTNHYMHIKDEVQLNEYYTSNSGPDEFTYFHYPSLNRLDITLGRTNSSATKNSSAYAALKSSAISSGMDKKSLYLKI